MVSDFEIVCMEPVGKGYSLSVLHIVFAAHFTSDQIEQVQAVRSDFRLTK